MGSNRKEKPIENENIFKKYSSTIERVNIPLPDFRFYHRASDEHEIDDSFVGRKHIIRILSNWLRDEKTKTGAYLVSGYRGMGKTSFVGKVLHDVSAQESKWKFRIYQTGKCVLIITILSFFYLYIDAYEDKKPIPWGDSLRLVFCINILPLIAVLGGWWLYDWKKQKKDIKKGQNKIDFTTIKVNLGREILNEREVLCVIVKNVLQKYKERYQKSFCNFMTRYLILFVSFLITFYLYFVFIHPFLSQVIDYYYSTFIDKFIENLPFFFNKISPDVYLLFPFCVCIFFLVWRGLVFWFNKTIGGRELKQLYRLNERIDSVISEHDNPVNLGSSYLSLSFNATRRRSYPQANSREIEQELIEILDKIAKDNLFKCRFVFVFDELDKLEPDIPQDMEENDRLPEFEFTNSGFSGGAASRVRKQSVLNFLAKLKFFLTTAKCKFVFISGRELYDAYLADVSDREFSISSIFNGVLYVNSFLSEEGNKNIKDIATLTEHYICRKLMRGKLLDSDPDEKTLRGYYTYMRGFYDKEKLDVRELDKALLVLYQFSLYLSHVCNGSPKKITIYFEKYVRNWEFVKHRNNSITIRGGKEHANYYLSFSYRSQVKIGFVHYMAYPLIQAIINRRSEYGDKLLVSASFLVNHIYKHHNSGFSWRNLEYIPELMEVNKTPELRDFIGYIIDFLSQSHIRSMESGLYRYKFPMRVVEEISLNSKYSEEVSAIFNFTLDESLSVKKHYDQLLRHYAKNYEVKDQMQDAQILASIHHVLGDLYMADEDYSQAILEFKLCAQILENKIMHLEASRVDIPAGLMLFLVRNMLKLGYVYEKRNTWDPAFAIYSELIGRLVKFKYNVGSYDRSVLTPESNKMNAKLSLFDDIQLTYLPSLAKLAVLEKMEPTGITIKDLEDVELEFRYMFSQVREKDKYIIAVDFFRKVGEILYYKNGFLEEPKDNLWYLLYFWSHGISGVNIEKPWIEEDKDLLKKIKYSTINSITDNELQNSQRVKDIVDGIKRSSNMSFRLNFCRVQQREMVIHGRSLPCYACKYYSQSLYYILKYMLEGEGMNSAMNGEESSEGKKINDVTRSLLLMKYLLKNESNNKLLTKREDTLYITASTLDGFANVILSCSDKNVRIRSVFMDFFFRVLKSENLDNPQTELTDRLQEEGEETELFPIEKVLIYYWDASEFYKHASHRAEAAQCTKKMLRVLLAYLQVHKNDDKIKKVLLDHMDTIKDKLIQKAIISLYSRYEHINLSEMQKIRDIFSKDFEAAIELNKLSIFPDIEEFCYLYYTLYLACGKTSELCYIYKSRFMSRFRVHNTIYERVINLQYKAMFNRHILERLLFGDANVDIYSLLSYSLFCESLSKCLESSSTIGELLGDYATCFKKDDVEYGDKLKFIEFLIYDSHLCLTWVINYISPNSNSTLFSHSYIGSIYQRLFEWNNIFRFLHVLYKIGECETDGERSLRIQQFVARIKRKDTEGGVNSLLQECVIYKCVDKIMWHKNYPKKMAKELKDFVFGHLGISDQHLLEPTYQAEMAIMYYARAKEMHKQGKSYKSMIRGLHVLDDDLNNDTCQFDYAIERYLINSGCVDNELKKLKDFYKQSKIYKIDSYNEVNDVSNN